MSDAPGPAGGGMRIKNLDTGEEYDLEDYDTRPPSSRATAPLAEDEPDPEALSMDGSGSGSGKKKSWLKGSKKLKNWAKSTLSTVRERIEERIDKHQQQQQQQSQRTQSSPGGAGAASEAPPSHSALQLEGPLAAGLRDRPGSEVGHSRSSSYVVSEAGTSFSSTFGGLAAGSGGAAPPPASSTGAANIGAGAGLMATSTATAGAALPVSTSASVVPGAGVGVGVGISKAAAAAAAGAAAGSSTVGGGTSSAGLPPLHPVAPPPRGSLPPLPAPGRMGRMGGGFAAAVAAASAAAAAGGEAGASGAGGGLEGGPGIQASMEMRVPLLQEDAAGPSSRAVPVTKSYLNMASRVTGGRRAAARQLQQVRMVQEVLAHDGVVWSMRFSADSRLLASAGRDGVVRIWSVYWYPQGRPKLISSAQDPDASTRAGASSSSAAYGAAHGPGPPSTFHSAAAAPLPRPPLLSESPLLALTGHSGDVLDMSWSQCRLLLTASADQTARLWYLEVPVVTTGGSSGGGGGGGGGGEGGGDGGSAAAAAQNLGAGEASFSAAAAAAAAAGATGMPASGECLRTFVHPDFVTSCCFHPTDPRRMVTGCADGKIRVWSVPDGTVLCTATVQQDLVTRVIFSLDGKRVLAGTLRGKARHYDYTGSALDYAAQLDVKNLHRSGRKVTGLLQVPFLHGNDQVYLITSADSRIRLYVGYSQERKFKGHRHNNTQLAAALSPNCRYLVCGSDDGWVYMWETGLMPPAPPPTAASGASAGGGGLRGGSAKPSGGGAKQAKEAAGGLRGGLLTGKMKEGLYEAFQTPEQTATVVLFAPDVCRVGRGLERSHSSVSAAGSSGPVAAAAGASSSLFGTLFVVAGFSGRIYVYENLPPGA